MALIDKLKNWDCVSQVSKLCAELIRFPSENPPGEMGEIAVFIQRFLDDIGMKTELIHGPNGQPNVVGELEFGAGPTLILNGHMDVVPAGDRSRWEWDPFGGENRDGYILGRGASDMKGGLAGLMVALANIAKSPASRGRIVFMAVPDEETGGENGTKFLLEHGISGDACLIAEPSGINPTIGQKGNIWFKAVTRGMPAHGSLSPAVGRNAIRVMNSVIDDLYMLWRIEWPLPDDERRLIADSQATLTEEGNAAAAEALGHVSVNVGKISGGRKVNMIPEECEAEFDLRVPIGISTDTVLANLRRILEIDGRSDVRLELLSSPNEANFTHPRSRFIQLLLTVIKEMTGVEPRPVLQWASSDARYFRYKGIPTVQFGPAELDGIHGYNERVRIEALAIATRVYAGLAYTYLEDTDGPAGT